MLLLCQGFPDKLKRFQDCLDLGLQVSTLARTHDAWSEWVSREKGICYVIRDYVGICVPFFPTNHQEVVVSEARRP